MEKIKVKICEGTTCFVMGGDTVKSMTDILAQKYKDKIEIIPVKCFGSCQEKDSFSKAPYVSIDDELVESADIEKVTKIIESKLKNE